MKSSVSTCVAVGVLFALSSHGSYATTPLPEAVWNGQISVTTVSPTADNGSIVPITGPGTFTNGPSTLIGKETPSLSIVSGASASGLGYYVGSGSQVELDYFIEVIGTQGFVPLNVSGMGKVSVAVSNPSEEGSIASVSLRLVQNEGVADIGSFSLDTINGVSPIYGTDFGIGLQPGFNPGNFSLQATTMVETNSLIEVQMSDSAIIEVQQGSGSAHSFIDPFFSIDPNFANADQYSILTSPGIENVPTGVPEPSTWAMLLLGSAGLGLAAYRRTKAGSVPFVAA